MVLLTAIIDKIQEFYTQFFQINHLVALLEISPTNFTLLKTFNSEFQKIKV